MTEKPKGQLRTGFTTGACATAAAAAAARRLLTGAWEQKVTITLPRGQEVSFELAHRASGDGWAEAGIIKDAGDDPDVTHGCLVKVRVEPARAGVSFAAGQGVGTVTRAGLPVAVGEPAINPVPRAMMKEAVTHVARSCGGRPDFLLTVSIPGGADIARKTWNPRLGIVGGLSILGTTGIVRPYSCSAWIASIHRGIDVARAAGETHVCGATGNTSEQTAQRVLGLPDHAMLDMGDFAGGMLKYIARHPVGRVTIAGGIGKLTKLAQGAMDLHSSRSQVDFERLSDMASDLGADPAAVRVANTASQALEIVGPQLADAIAQDAAERSREIVAGAGVLVDVMVVDRDGKVLAATDAA